MTADAKMAFHMNRNNLIPLFFGHGREHTIAADSGVIYHNMQAAKIFNRRFDNIQGVFVTGYVGCIGKRLSAGRDNFIYGCFC